MSGRTDADIHHVGIFGRRLSGKTTLTIHFLATSYAREKRMAVVLDPKMGEHNWGNHCYVTNNREKWLAKWQHPQCRNCNVVWEETSTTLKRDRSFADVFTAKAGAHGHRLIITGHTAASLLPEMRDQITEIFVFRQSLAEAEKWADQFADPRVRELAMSLDYGAREFLHVRMGCEPRKLRLVLP